ncbi:MAG: helix-turn-helix domain-containing protein, partial [Pirellulales bacterium]
MQRGRTVKRSSFATEPREFPHMADEDFDVDRLAAYLHRMPADVAKLAERGKLPGRRVGGAWRFSAAEIHHWME